MNRIRLAWLIVLAVMIGLGSPLAAPASSHKTAAVQSSNGTLAQFSTEAAAKSHCRKDRVVWLNINSGVYHEKGMRWYGNTKQGAYVCRREADAAGSRDTRNGQ
jgi:hypothetical protein